MVSKGFSYATKNNFADLFSSLADFQIQLLSEKKKSEMHYVLMNGWGRKDSKNKL